MVSVLTASPPSRTSANIVLKCSMNNRNGLKCCCVNARSMCNKLDEINMLLCNVDMDVICITETWLKGYINNATIDLPGFKVFRNDRDVITGGGVCMYVRNSLRTKLLYKYSNPNLEMLLIELVCNEAKILLGVCYRTGNVNCISELESVFYEYTSEYSDIVLCGDFNFNMLSSAKKYDTFRNLLKSYDLSIVNNEPTYFYDGGSSMLDLVITNTDKIMFLNQLSVGFTDHDFLYWTYGNFETPNSQKIFYRDFRNINYDELVNELITFPWTNIYYMSNINEQIDLFNSYILCLYDKYVPLKPVKQSNSKCPWITREIRNLIILRDYALSIWKETRSCELRAVYTKIRNKVTSLIRTARQNFLNTKLNSEQSSKSFWQTIGDLGLGKDSNYNVSDSFEPSEFLNEFGSSTSINSGSPEFTDLLGERIFDENSFSFKTITIPTLTRALYGIKSNSIGDDGISIKFIKIVFPFIASYLLAIVNNIITYSLFPDIWKHAKVIPIPKINNPTIVSEFRPISILSSLSKVLERVLSDQIVQYLDDSVLLDVRQSAYRSYHSTSTAVLNVVDDIRRRADINEASILVLLDFTKAFDRVDHAILLQKLMDNFKFGRSACSLLYSYLSNRTTAVFSMNKLSNRIVVNLGVPQGSVLGPLLFTMYINDLSKVLSCCKYHLYADDVQIYASSHLDKINDCIDDMNMEIKYIAEWAKYNNLLLNAKKTQAIVIHRKEVDTRNISSIKVNNEIINFSNTVRNLGITINKTLTWDDHIQSITRAFYFSIRRLWALTKFASPQLRRRLFLTYIFPNLIYGDVVFFGMQGYNLTKFRKLFNAGVRYVYKLRKFDRISCYVNLIIGCPIDKYYEFRVCALIFKILKYGKPIYLSEKLMGSKSVRTKNLMVPKNRYDIFNHSFYVRGICLWNTLPVALKLSMSYISFKHQYFNHDFN